MNQNIEKSIIKTYRKEIWSKFVKAVKTYNLINEGDKIAVCISGGKDSFLLAKCMQELQRHGVFKFDLFFMTMDPGYDKKVVNNIKQNCQKLNIAINVFKTPIFKMIKGEKNSCYLCAKKRRGYLYDYAKQNGCNKIALGHHFDDVIETILLNILYSGIHQTMMPKVFSKNFEKIELIRPLYLIDEKDIIRWQQYHKLDFIDCACDMIKKIDSKRETVRKLITELMQDNKYVRKSIFKASENVNLNALLGYTKNTNSHNFLEDYETKT